VTTYKWRLITSVALGSLLLVGVLTWITRAREGARASTCKGRLSYLGYALQSYHDEYGVLPPAYVEDSSGRRMHSWRVLLLAFCDNRELYEQYRFDEPWNGPHNSLLADKLHPSTNPYSCPSDVEGTQTSYVVIVGPRTLWPGSTSVGFDAGSSDTLLVLEIRDSGIGWMEPRDLEFDEAWAPVNSAHPRLERVHSGVLYYVNAAGRVLSIDPLDESARLKQLMTIE